MKNKIIAKLNSVNGESLIETLVAVMIMSLALVMLPGAIVAASNINSKVEKAKIFASDAGVKSPGFTNVGITNNAGSEAPTQTSLAVEYYHVGEDGEGYYYYVVK